MLELQLASLIETKRDLPFSDIATKREAFAQGLRLAKHTFYGKRHWWGPGGRHRNPNRDVERMLTAGLLQAAGIETIFVEAPAEYQPLIDRVQQWGRLSFVIFPMTMRQLVNLQDNPAALGFEPHWKGENCLIPHLLFATFGTGTRVVCCVPRAETDRVLSNQGYGKDERLLQGARLAVGQPRITEMKSLWFVGSHHAQTTPEGDKTLADLLRLEGLTTHSIFHGQYF